MIDYHHTLTEGKPSSETKGKIFFGFSSKILQGGP